MKKRIGFSVILWIAGVWVASAQTPAATQSFSLNDAIGFALKNNPGMKNAQLDIQKAQAQVSEVASFGLPQISAAATVNDFIQLPASFVPARFFNPLAGPDDYAKLRFGTQWQIQAGAQASQLLFDGSYLVGLQASREVMSLFTQIYGKSKLDVEINVTKAYFQILTLQENIRLMEANLERIGKLLYEMRAMNKQGFVEATDVDKLELAYSNLQVQKKNLVNLTDIAYKALKLQMGMDVNIPVQLTDDLEKLYTSEMEDLSKSDFNINGRVEYKLLMQQQKLNLLDKKRYQMSYLPNLAFFAAYNVNLNRNSDNLFKNTPQLPWVPVTLIGLKASVPVFDGFYKKSKTDQANVNILKTQNDIFNAANAFNLEYSAARIRYNTAAEMISIQKKNMELAQRILDVTQKKYKEGLANSTELQAAETDLKTAQANYLNAIYDLLTAKTDLRKALGK